MIQKISDTTKQAILRKTPYAHGTRPSEEGMPAQQVKRLFYAAIGDESNSVLAEMERMRREANDSLNAKSDVDQKIDDIESACDSAHYPSTLAVMRYVDKKSNVFRLYFSDVAVPAASWQALAVPLGDYTHSAWVPLPSVTAAMVPEVYFSPADVARPQIATFAYCEEGGLRLYATQVLAGAVHIDLIACSLPTAYSVSIDAAHATVTVRDQNGKIYEHGDVVAVGTRLQVSVRPADGYHLTSVLIGGAPCSGDTVDAFVTVSGTVWIAVVASPNGAGVLV